MAAQIQCSLHWNKTLRMGPWDLRRPLSSPCTLPGHSSHKGLTPNVVIIHTSVSPISPLTAGLASVSLSLSPHSVQQGSDTEPACKGLWNQAPSRASCLCPCSALFWAHLEAARHSPEWGRSPPRGCTRRGTRSRGRPQERPRGVSRTSPGRGDDSRSDWALGCRARGPQGTPGGSP